MNNIKKDFEIDFDDETIAKLKKMNKRIDLLNKLKHKA